MILNSRNNLFLFNFPKAFIPDEVSKKYDRYLNRMPGNLITKSIDLVNYSVQSLNLPSTTYNPVSQVKKYGRNFEYRDSLPEQELLAKELTVTFQLLDGYINYWILLDTLTYWYSFPEPEPFIPEGCAIRILDAEGHIIVTSVIKHMLFKEISALDMSFSNNAQEFSTFDCTFSYNELESKVELD